MTAFNFSHLSPETRRVLLLEALSRWGRSFHQVDLDLVLALAGA